VPGRWRVSGGGAATAPEQPLAIATTERGDQLDLLVVPPQASDTVARGTLAIAADPTGTVRAPDALAAAAVPVPTPDGDADRLLGSSRVRTNSPMWTDDCGLIEVLVSA